MSIRRVGSSPVSRTRIRSPMGRPLYARVVELADSLDSGSSVLYGRAGSSPASRTKDLPVIPVTGRLFYPSLPEQVHTYLCARVVELADSLDSGSSVLYGRAGSSPASRTKKRGTRTACPSLFGALIYPYDLAYMMGTY